MNAAAARPAHDDRDSRAPAVTALRGEVCDLIESAGNEICKLHLRDRAHAHQGRADGCADDRRFRNRRIDDAQLAELFQHSSRDFEGAAVDADIFAQDEHTIVLFHLFPDALTDRLDVRG